MKTRLAWILLPAALLLAGCDERYRYPCQDPHNWNKEECQKPYCSANGTCPEDLRHYDKANKSSTLPGPVMGRPSIKGDTKC
jgi:hypothetical protein